MDVWDTAVTPTNDILLATSEPGLKQIEARSNKVTDSVYCEDINNLSSVHETKDGKVVVGGQKWVTAMDTGGNYLTIYKNDMNNKRLFDGAIRSITSTRNGEIFVVQNFPFSRVFVLKNEDVISIYTGHPSVNKFDPTSVVTTPLDNVIVAEQCNYKLHILDNNGHLLTIYNTKVIGSEYPSSPRHFHGRTFCSIIYRMPFT